MTAFAIRLAAERRRSAALRATGLRCAWQVVYLRLVSDGLMIEAREADLIASAPDTAPTIARAVAAVAGRRMGRALALRLEAVEMIERELGGARAIARGDDLEDGVTYGCAGALDCDGCRESIEHRSSVETADGVWCFACGHTGGLYWPAPVRLRASAWRVR